MNSIRTALAIAVAFLAALGFSGTAVAFHGGGVAHCDGCHTMHNSADGQTIIPGGTVGTGINSSLTKGNDPSSTCLTCHHTADPASTSSYKVSTPEARLLTAGGDFGWLKKSFSWTQRGSLVTRTGNEFGHNIVALDFGYTQDPNFTTAPGGSYQAADLGCTSCHDPHGKVGAGTKGNLAVVGSGSYGAANPATAGQVLGAYRLLGGVGYGGGNGTVIFASAAPIARAPSSGAQTNVNHVDYGQGMSEWCANCHTSFDDVGIRHPAGNNEGLDDFATNYNRYVKTGDFTGTQATAFLELVPFERQITDRTQLSTTSTTGPDATDNVMCLTCHRAHATAFPDMLRWDQEVEFLKDSHPAATDAGVSGNDVLNSYYGRDIVTTFGDYQRSLCNKCHVQD